MHQTQLSTPISPLSSSEDSKDITKLATGASVSLVGKVGGIFIQILSQVFLARFLGPELFGLYAIGWTILRMASRIATLGLDKGVLRFAPIYWKKDDAGLKGTILQSITYAFGAGLMIGGILFVSSPWLANQVFKKSDLLNVFHWTAIALPFATTLYVAEAATRVSQRMKYSIYAEQISQPLGNLILFIVFFFLGWKILGAMVAVALSFFIALIIALSYIKLLFPEAFSLQVKQKTIIRTMIVFSLPASLASLFSQFNTWVDRLLVGYFLSLSEAGIYQAVSQSSIVFLIILSAFGAIFAPMIVDLYYKKENERLNEVFKVSTKWCFYVCLPICLGICFVARDFMIALFGHEYIEGSLPLIILTTGQIMNVGSGIIGLLLIMTEQTRNWLIFSGIALLVNVILNSIFIPVWGISGAALGTTCAIGGLFVAGLILVKNRLDAWPFDKRYLKGLFAAGVTLIFLFILNRFEINIPFLSVGITMVVSILVFILTLFTLGLENEDKELMRIITGRIVGLISSVHSHL